MKFLLILVIIIDNLTSKKLTILPQHKDLNLRKTVAIYKDDSSIHRLRFLDREGHPCMAEVKIGSQTFKMAFETGSPMTWVPLKGCNSCGLLGIDKYIDGQDDGRQNSYLYRNGYSEINLQISEMINTINIADTWAHEQIFAGVTKISDSESFQNLNFKADGVIGLGYEKFKNEKILLSILDTIFLQEHLNKRVFSFYLNPKKEKEANDIPNHFTFGDFDKNLIKPKQNLAYCKVIKHIDWAISLRSISLEGEEYGKNFVYKDTLNTGAASIRSETNSIILPRIIWEEFLNTLNRIGRRCSKHNDLDLITCTDTEFSNYPDIVFDLCGHKAVLNPIDYIEVKEKKLLLHIQTYDGKNKLVSCILGNVFMRKYYTVFNLYRNQIGFALANMGPIDMSKWKWNSNIRLDYLLSIGLLILLTKIF